MVSGLTEVRTGYGNEPLIRGFVPDRYPYSEFRYGIGPLFVTKSDPMSMQRLRDRYALRGRRITSARKGVESVGVDGQIRHCRESGTVRE